MNYITVTVLFINAYKDYNGRLKAIYYPTRMKDGRFAMVSLEKVEATGVKYKI